MNGYVLVGGRSRRMGTSKAGLFLDRVVRAARPVFDDVIAVARAGESASAGVTTIFEPQRDDAAAIFGLARAMAHAEGEKCIVLAVDYPLITTDLLLFLSTRFRASRASLLVTEWDARLQPLCAGYDSGRVAPLIEKRILAGRLDLHGIVDAAEAEIVRESELRARFPGEPLLNVNTPQELARMEKLNE